MEAKLVINGVEVALGYEELDGISSCLSDNKKNGAVFDELAKSPSSMVRMNVSWNKAISDSTVQLLLADSSIEVLRGIVENGRSRWIITEEILKGFIANGDTELLCTVADEVGDFYECDVDRICEKLVHQKDPQIRRRLASNSDTPEEFIEELIDDEDMDVARAARFPRQPGMKIYGVLVGKDFERLYVKGLCLLYHDGRKFCKDLFSSACEIPS